MENLETIRKHSPDERDQAREYLFDMIRQMAQLARGAGERSVAIHLEAIIAARRAAADDRLFS